VGSSAIPFVPLTGANSLYRAFDKAFICITLLWAILDPDRLLFRLDVRRRFIDSRFNISVGQRIGRRFLESINILGPLTADLTATSFLKIIASITLIYKLLFWREWISNGYDLPLLEEDTETACRKFSRSFSRRKMVSFIEGQMSSGFAGCTLKKECYNICIKAVLLGRLELYEDFTKKSFCIL
jgi:hypothetical protein